MSLRYGEVRLQRPENVAPLGEEVLELSFVEDVEPVHWRLLSSLPVHNPDEALRIVDIYRKRWLIEEFFKSLKTGCSAERRQARTLGSLWKTITLLVPIAYWLLALRVIARAAPDAPGTKVLGEIELVALRSKVGERLLPKKPTSRHVLLAVARLGGHLIRRDVPKESPQSALTHFDRRLQ